MDENNREDQQTQTETQEEVRGQPEGESSLDRLASVLEGLGFQDVSPDTLPERIAEAFQRERELRERYESHLASLMGEGRTDQTRQETAQQEQLPWDIPQIDLDAIRPFLKTTDDGEIRLSPETPPDLAAAYRRHEAAKRAFAEKLVGNPSEIFGRLVQMAEERAARLLEEKLREHERTSASRNRYSDLLSQHAEQLYERDPVTNQIDWSRHTPFGLMVTERFNELKNAGIADDYTALRYALSAVEPRTSEEKTTARLAGRLPQKNVGKGRHTEAKPRFESWMESGDYFADLLGLKD